MIPRICIQMPACKAEIARVDPPACIKGGARRVSPALRLVFSIIERARRSLVAAFAKSHSLRNLGPRTTHIRARARASKLPQLSDVARVEIIILRRSVFRSSDDRQPHLTSPHRGRENPSPLRGEGRGGGGVPRGRGIFLPMFHSSFSAASRESTERDAASCRPSQ